MRPELKQWVHLVLSRARAIDPFDASQAIAAPFVQAIQGGDARASLMLASAMVAAGLPTCVQGKCMSTQAVVDEAEVLVKGRCGWIPVTPHTGSYHPPMHTINLRYGG